MADTKLADLTSGTAEATDIVYAVKDPSGTPLDRKIALSSIKALAVGAGSVTVASSKTLAVDNSLTFVGTDSTTMTFPSTSATLARTDAGNTFTGNQTFGGNILLNGSTSGTVTLQPAAAAGTYTLTLPTSAGSSNQVLTTNGSGVLSWTTPSSGGTPGGSDTQLQYNSSGAFAGASGLTTTGTELTIASGTKTTDAPVLNATQTWNSSGVTFTGFKLNVTNTASASASLLMDLQVGGSSQFAVFRSGQLNIGGTGSTSNTILASSELRIFGSYGGASVSMANAADLGRISVRQLGSFSFSSGNNADGTQDLFLTRRAAANLRLGAADAAAPVAQTLSVQSVVAGTSNTAGANLTITGSQGTGTGAGGSIVFQGAPAGSSGTAQNALSTIFTVDPALGVVLATGYNLLLPSARLTYESETYISTVLDNGSGGARSFWAKGWLAFGNGNNNQFSFAPAGSGANNIDIETAPITSRVNLRIYNTRVDYTTNYERANVGWNSNIFILGTEKGSAGGTARALALQTDGTTRLTLDASTGAATFTSTITSGAISSTGTITSSATTANTAILSSTDYSLTGASAVSAIDLSGTWNTTGNPIALKLNITNTASGTTSLLMDLQVGGVSQFNVSKAGTVTLVDAANIAVGTTTGAKIGTATSQKLGFWNATPIVQPTTAVAAATVAATGTGDVVAASTTFDGYTIPQIVKALRNAGLLA